MADGSTTLLIGLAAAFAGGLVGALLMLALLRRRTAAAVALARAELQAELATASERLRGREEQLIGERATSDQLRQRLDEVAGRAAELQSRLAETETRLAEERQQAGEKLALLREAEQKLADAFARLSRQALDANADSFLQLARQNFETLQATAQGELEQRRQAIESLLAPFREQLGRYEKGVRDLESLREQAYGTLSEQVRGLALSQENLVRETGRLVTALRRPEVRGSWGEMQLRRAVEFAGMLEHVDFAPQETVQTEDGRLRPDMLVRLPGGKLVVVDAKAPLDAYLAAVEASDEEARKAALVRHARQVRNHLGKLAEKRYWDQFETAPDFVVLFLPGESFFSAALEFDPSLIEDAFRQSVLVVTPATLVALLKTVSYGWRQEAIAANASEISAAARELYERLGIFADHFAAVGKGLTAAVNSYNKAVGSFEGRLLPQARRFEALGPADGRDLPSPGGVAASPRSLATGAEPPPDDASGDAPGD